MPDFEHKEIYDEILNFAKNQATLNLLESGVDVNFFDKIIATINDSFFNNAPIDDLVDELDVLITGKGEGVGLLQRYVSQVSNDSITQFNASYNKAITDDLGFEFYKYVGTVIKGTRPFCEHYVNDYLHKKEVEELGMGKDPYTDKSLKSLELTAGRIAGTNKSNIFINRGGWNCRHYFSPITSRLVPKKDLNRNLKNGNWKPTEREKKFLK